MQASHWSELSRAHVSSFCRRRENEQQHRSFFEQQQEEGRESKWWAVRRRTSVASVARPAARGKLILEHGCG